MIEYYDDSAVMMYCLPKWSGYIGLDLINNNYFVQQDGWGFTVL